MINRTSSRARSHRPTPGAAHAPPPAKAKTAAKAKEKPSLAAVEVNAKARANLDASRVTDVASQRGGGLGDATKLRFGISKQETAPPPPPVVRGSEEWQALKPKAEEAVELAANLSPRAGFAFPWDDFAKLPEAAQRVLDTFAGLRNHIDYRAAQYGVGSGASPDRTLAPADVEAHLDGRLGELGKKAADAAQILLSGSRAKGIHTLTRQALRNAAATWAQRGASPGWQAATKLPAVKEPAPTAPARPADPLERFREQAHAEFLDAPQARGYPASEGRRDLVKEVIDTSAYGVFSLTNDVRAFTYDEWMRFRPAQLLRQEAEADKAAERSIPAWRL